MKNKEVLIIGGGLAGLTAAIHLSKNGLQVILIEKNEYPKHKVCGEYISNEVLPYLNWLDLDISSLHPTHITHLEFSTVSGKIIKSILPLGGFGISRYTLDEYLYKKAIANGCKIIRDTVDAIVFDAEEFTVTTSDKTILKSEIVIGAFGKRSNIDQKLNRNFIQKKSPWLAVKAHYAGNFPNDLVGLHNFKGGYCGVSKVENNTINICYLADYETFKHYKNIDEYQEKVVSENPHLKAILSKCKLLFEKPLTISQICFEKKNTVENHILMIGDTAGLIHPLCGNGMAMAIHSAKIVSELIEKFCNKEIKSRTELENKYKQEWDFNFKNRLKMGQSLALLLQKQKMSKVLLRILVYFPFVLPIIIKKTHGKPININS
ncbi:flavin-dependent dehydrogenase [Flavobacterium sp. CG_23.5]|uniref:NAD(P)/FAD-dependent oxidoreductase n=1 Tax=unclassified Flavobacterium TaxID=196869 RepID=UPI0018CB1F6A|nr:MULTISPECIES: NAD(P)/FAD-dependent oxidoreductase [unclassified Flavobacterium]MBG6111339.1 flavin-dependent dehydrogenase [Flavobacterium sp. CG_9.10]MBP2282127.1 flavin-dependent dehydrogenase [Flavobacterium sp. CG_23.5]